MNPFDAMRQDILAELGQPFVFSRGAFSVTATGVFLAPVTDTKTGQVAHLAPEPEIRIDPADYDASAMAAGAEVAHDGINYRVVAVVPGGKQLTRLLLRPDREQGV